MTTYLVAIGHDNQGSVAAIAPQPARRIPIQHGTIRRVPGGYSYGTGYKNTVLRWSGLDRTDYHAILNQFGITSDDITSCAITIAMDDDRSGYNYYNAVANYEENADRAMVFWEDLELKLLRLEQIDNP